MTISIIIPNYNGANLLGKNLPKILEACKPYKGYTEIIVSDDASDDDSVEVINKFPVKLVRNTNPQERGFASNVNHAARVAMGEILVLLNTDVTPKKNFLDPLLVHFENSQVFAVGCMDESVENGRKVQSGRGLGKWQKGFLFHKRGETDRQDTFWVTGGSGAFRKSLWNMLGGLQELYDPFYWEDIDLSYRAQKAGYTLIFESKSVVVHEHQKGAIQTQFTNAEVKKIAYRNQFFFVWLNITDLNLLISHLLWLPYHILNAIRRKDFTFIIGLSAAIIRFPQVLRVRGQSKKTFIKRDKDILKC